MGCSYRDLLPFANRRGCILHLRKQLCMRRNIFPYTAHSQPVRHGRTSSFRRGQSEGYKKISNFFYSGVSTRCLATALFFVHKEYTP